MFTVKQVASALPWRKRMLVPTYLPTYILHYMMLIILVL